MIDDLTGYGPDARLEADLCVVGTGAAGIALASEFLHTRTSVILLEAGGLAPDPQTDALKAGEAEGMPEAGLVEGRGRSFGGTTTLWAGQCIPLDPMDFEARPWVPDSGWPIGMPEMGPFYKRAAEVLAVPGEPHDESLWSRWGIQPPALDPSRIGHSYTVWSPKPDLGRTYAKALRRSDNVRVLLHANVTGIQTDPAASAVSGVVARSLDGSLVHVAARVCVLCCGGIENARLLLMSGDPEAGGLANPHDTVGRYFQDHPNRRSAMLQTSRPQELQEPYSLLYRGRRRYLPKLTLAPEAQRAARVLNCGANLQYEFANEGLNAMRRVYRASRRDQEPDTSLRADLRLALRGVPAAATTGYRRLARGRSSSARPATIWLQTHSEQAPNPESRVVLARGRDALGSNVAKVEWRLTDLDRRTPEVMAATVGLELERLGLARTELCDGPLSDSYHHIGTTRMATDPKHGVVDADCRVHGVEGLYIAGSSVFPTSGFANPTLTIVALTLRLADRLRADLL